MGKGRIVRRFAETATSRGKVVLFALRILGLDSNEVETDGGPGSGNFGHAGRPGKVGGSAKGSGGSAFRSGSRESGYSSFAKTAAFRGIASSARKSANYREFVSNMSEFQKDALIQQWSACGTEEMTTEYAKRVYAMLHDRKTAPVVQKNKPVDGKDIVGTWQYQGEKVNRLFTDTSGTKAIDTEIEDVIHQQGFDGVPKIVTREEFDRIAKENPQMPILFRSYAANGQEQLRSYDDDLERGHFYVDCGTGGAGYGQGMYAAGVYKKSPAKMSDLSKLEEAEWIDAGDGDVYIMDKGGTSYRGTDQFGMMDDGEIRLFMRKDDEGNVSNPVMLRKEELFDDDGLPAGEMMIDVSTGKPYEGSVDDFDYCRDVNDRIDAKRVDEIAEAERQKALNGAKEEMNHYKNLNMKRIRENAPLDVPDGMELILDDDRYFDRSKGKSMSEELPEDGEEVAIWEDESKNTVISGKVVTERGQKVLQLPITSFNINPRSIEGFNWAPIEGRGEPQEVDPVATTRMMTLDPSARIISYKDIHGEAQKAKQKIYAERLKENVDEFLKKKRVKSEAISDLLYYSCRQRKDDWQRVKEIEDTMSDEDRKTWSRINANITVNEIRDLRSRALDIASSSVADAGVLAAMLGYDAINAEGHGETGSYTVVLNRTKVILCDEPVA